MTHKTKEPRLSWLGKWLIKRIFRDEGDAKLGDFMEIYLAFVEEKGKRVARLKFWAYLIRSIPEYSRDNVCTGATMIQNYLKIALRGIKKNKGYSFINILGLSIGMACFMLIMLFVHWELSYDGFHENVENKYRVIVRTNSGTYNFGKTTMGVIPAPMAATMAEEYPEVVQITRVHRARNHLFIHDTARFEETGLYADENFLKIFSFPLARGTAITALREPMTMVITRELGAKYFGHEDPMGKILIMPYRDENYDFKITGVLEDVPENSHLRFDFLISLVSKKILDGESKYEGRWNNWNAFIYVELGRNADPHDFAGKLSGHLEKHSGREQDISFILQPIKSIHLKSDAFIEVSENYKMSNIYIFSCIAFVILIIACINYINLATARAFRRSREIGIRKVLGAVRGQVIRQLLGESVLLAFIAFFIAALIVALALPHFNAFINRTMKVLLFSDIVPILILLGVIFFVGIAAGIFPALFLSAFQPAKTVKGNSFFKRKHGMRDALVLIQFCISIILIAGTLIILRQMNFIRSRNMGFDREQILVVDVKDQKLRGHLAAIKNSLVQNPNIQNASTSWHLPSLITPRWNFTVEEGTLPDSGNRYGSYYTVVDENFFDVYGIELLSGRGFSNRFANEADESVILNETAVRQLGWDKPVGKIFRSALAQRGRVIGVIRDFHFHTLHRQIDPLVIAFKPDEGRYLSLKIRTPDLRNTIASIQKTIESYHPDYPFAYFFFDDSFNDMYRDEQKLGTMFGGFSALSIFIACLGLLGLATFTVEIRTKEVGIRKVLGSTLSGIFILLSKDFIKWVIVANLIAWPAVYFVMNEWLKSFAYRTDLSIWIFILSGSAAFFMALLTVSYQSIKAAKANPVDSLRYE